MKKSIHNQNRELVHKEFKKKRNGKRTNEQKKEHDINYKLILVAKLREEELYSMFRSSEKGMKTSDIEGNKETYGINRITQGEKNSIWKKIAEAFINPFTVILLCLVVVSFITDIIMARPGEEDPMAVIIITTMVMVSGLLRFTQEVKSGNAAEKLTEMITTTTCVERVEKGVREIPLDEIVVGDLIHLSAGDMIPADLRIIRAKDLFVSQSALTGESDTIEKVPTNDGENQSVTEMVNLAFMGTNVISGSASGIVVAVGDHTLFGGIASKLTEQAVSTSFEKGVNSVSWVLIRFMLIMVPIVLFLNGFTKGNWMNATLFAISIAVGLTPEMLPMIVTTCLAKGAVAMSKEKTIIKNLNSIQNLGSIDLLCTDKTGTLTHDKVVLEYHLDIHGQENARVLRHGFLNSYYQTGLKNLMDIAIIEQTKVEQLKEQQLKNLETLYSKVDEIPFDFERRRMSVVVEDENGKRQMITKGAVEEMLSICSYAEYQEEVAPLTEDIKVYILDKVNELNENGMRVIAVAQKTNPSPVGAFSVQDENDMVLIGYLAFLDPPKETTKAAIAALKEYGVGVKILTGDNDKVTRCICKQVGIESNHIVLGSEVDNMTDDELMKVADKTNVFAKLSPLQKARIITVLRDNGHCVGYMGDGINDAPAMKASDVGISVDTAVDIAKESADVILLEKDLMVLERGIIEGRKTYANMMKYIKMTASSNFGNMLSVLLASAFLPFLPMESIHLILLNLIYDISCTTIPWDNVDYEFIKKPRKWEASSVGKFMLWIGPTSSIFDITTFLLMYFILCPMMFGGKYYHQLTDPSVKTMYISLFQAGWFVESMWSQTLVIHMIRTPKISFVQSNASLPVTILTFTGIGVLTCIPFTIIGTKLGLAALPLAFFPWLALTIILYMVFVTVTKKLYINRYGELL